MKKYLGFFIVLTMLVVAGAALAEEGSTSTNKGPGKPTVEKVLGAKREAMKLQIEQAREEAKKKMEALREKLKLETDAVKAKLGEDRIVGREKALERFDKAVLRMSELSDRVAAHMEKLEAKGVDTSPAEAHMDIAEEKLTAAKAKIKEAGDLLSKSVEKLTAEDKTKLRTLAQDTQKLLVETRLALRDAVKSLKDAIKAKLEAEKPKDDSDDENEEENEDQTQSTQN